MNGQRLSRRLGDLRGELIGFWKRQRLGLSALALALVLTGGLVLASRDTSDTVAPTSVQGRRFTIETPTPFLDGLLALQKTYLVQPGDTLSLIATRFRVSEKDLQSANHLADPDSVYAGQKLLIPQSAK